MRFVIYGAGAIGATIGGRLHESGHEVLLIARGAHAQALRETGLLLESHEGHARIQLPVFARPADICFSPRDIVLLAMKTQDTAAALDELASVAPPETPVACAQNGVENERLALRRFTRVQGISVMCPCAYLRPGQVQAFGTPVTGILDVGRYPWGHDELSEQLAAAFRASKFDSVVRPEILRFKYGKLLFNLGNAIEAVCGPAARKGPLGDLVQREATACLRAAGVDFDDEGAKARGTAIADRPLGEIARPGGSSWQSLARGTGNVETDYLNGEIVMLGRAVDFPTPANSLLQRLSNEMARDRRPPGRLTPEQVLERLSAGNG